MFELNISSQNIAKGSATLFDTKCKAGYSLKRRCSFKFYPDCIVLLQTKYIVQLKNSIQSEKER